MSLYLTSHKTVDPRRESSVARRRQLVSTRSIARNRPSGIYSRVSSTVLSSLLTRSPSDRITIRASTTANIFLIFNRIASGKCYSIRSGIHRALHGVNCASSRINLSTSSYNIITTVARRDTRVGRNITHLANSRRATTDHRRHCRTRNTNSRNIVFNCTASRAPALVPLPVCLTRRLTFHLARIHGSNRIPRLHPSNGARMAVRCSSGSGPIHLSAILVSARRSPRIARS